MLFILIPVCFISGSNSCSRSKLMGLNAPVEGSSDMEMVPPVKIKSTALCFSTMNYFEKLYKDNGKISPEKKGAS
ncbi:hypothetical protein SDC9_197341 [bioreactor metagenome]|uniref:Uncharacterized protein n=1 Tax=bioreactor metagenome TaxID=1076179 RepID=A0A645IGX5_9ZZZZ